MPVPSRPGSRVLSALGLAAALVLPTAPAAAQGFTAAIAPPRFELQLKPGERIREVIEIQHASGDRGTYRIYTNDWTLGADLSVQFSDALAPGSCRPWVALERRELTLDAGSRYRYRYEIQVPVDAPPGECRFAIMVEGLSTAQLQGGPFNFPVGGRIAVIVYAAIGGAAPKLSVQPAGVQTVNGQALPVIKVRNDGTAHGRLAGFLDATDAAGQRLEMAAAENPILPGETRTIALVPVAAEGVKPPTIRYPLDVRGTLESGAARLPLNARFEP